MEYRRLFNDLACMLMRNRRNDSNIDAAGIQLTDRDADGAGWILQRPGIVFKGMRQGAALRAEQQQGQQQV